jgi:hypothetical protein
MRPTSLLSYILRAAVPFLTAYLLNLYFKIRRTIRFDYESNEAIDKARYAKYIYSFGFVHNILMQDGVFKN